MRFCALKLYNFICERLTLWKTVVQLFNAIKAAQKTLERVQSDGIQKPIEEGMYFSAIIL